MLILGLNKRDAAFILIEELEEETVLDDVVDGVVEIESGDDEYKESNEEL